MLIPLPSFISCWFYNCTSISGSIQRYSKVLEPVLDSFVVVLLQVAFLVMDDGHSAFLRCVQMFSISSKYQSIGCMD